MRGVIGVILAGLGACLILVAILLPTWVDGQVVKFPLNEYETATLAASNASYFSAASLSEKTGVSMEATYTIKGDASKGQLVDGRVERVQLRLRPHQPPGGPGDDAHVRVRPAYRPAGQLLRRERQRDSTVRQTGLVGYVFPIGTQKQTYQVFDTTLKKPMPFVYSGTTTVHGIQAYEFVENVTPMQITTLSVPGSFVGSAPRRSRRRSSTSCT